MLDYLLQILAHSKAAKGSDVHFSVGVPAGIRIDGDMRFQGIDSLSDEHIREIARIVLGDELFDRYEVLGEADCAVSFDGIGRFRVNAFRQKGNASIVMRRLNDVIPDPEDLDLPQSVIDMAELKQGLVLVTGPTGSGKSTTLASLLGKINKTKPNHIITPQSSICTGTIRAWLASERSLQIRIHT
jgi:twitching motility protein PilT